MVRTFKILFVLALLTIVSVFAYLSQNPASTTSSNDGWTTVVVLSTNMQLNVSGSDNNPQSRTTCMVYTDKGTYQIMQDGIFARPSLVGRVNIGDTIDIKTTWFDFPLIGEYKVITAIR